METRKRTFTSLLSKSFKAMFENKLLLGRAIGAFKLTSSRPSSKMKDEISLNEILAIHCRKGISRVNIPKKSMIAASIAILMIWNVQVSMAQFTFGNPQTNPFSLSNTGLNTTVSFGDLDQDGATDIIAGDYQGNIYFIKNTGSNSSPSFPTKLTNPFSITAIVGRSIPVFVDLDADGDLDLMVGSLYGEFFYYENITTDINNITFATVQTDPFNLTDVGFYSAPAFADLDNDGDLDILSGDNTSSLIYMENIGSASNPNFSTTVVTNPFSLTDLSGMNTNVKSRGVFEDLDSDGDLDYFTSSESGNFHYYENVGSIGNPIFTTQIVNPFGVSNTTYAPLAGFMDMDGDGDKDMLQGDHTGAFTYRAKCTEANVTSFTASSTDSCPGALISLSFSGSLNDATQWVIYKGSCGGTLVNSTSGSSILVAPSVTTTYYIRGEDGAGCLDEATIGCHTSSITITVDQDNPVPNIATLPNVLGQCSVGTVTAPTASDFCAGSVTGTTSTTFPITSQGTTVVTWTYDDGNGNSATQDQNVIVNDTHCD